MTAPAAAAAPRRAPAAALLAALLALPLAAKAIVFLPVGWGLLKLGTLAVGSGGASAAYLAICEFTGQTESAWCQPANAVTDNVIKPGISKLAQLWSQKSGQFGMALVMGLQSSESCVMCMVLAALLRMVEVLGEAAFSLLAAPLLWIMAGGFLLVHTVQVAAGFAGLRPLDWRHTAGDGLWFILAVLLLGGMGLTGAAVAHDLYSGLVAPFITAAAGSAIIVFEELDRLGHLALAAVTPGASADPVPGLLESSRQKEQGIMDSITHVLGLTFEGSADSLLRALVVLVDAVQSVAALGMGRGVAYVAGLPGLNPLAAVASVLIGLFLIAGFIVYYLIAGLRFAEPLIRIALLLALSPVAIAALPFERLRSGVGFQVVKGLAYCGAYLFLAILFYALVLSILIRSMAVSVHRPDVGYTQLAAVFAASAGPHTTRDAEGAGELRDLDAPGHRTLSPVIGADEGCAGGADCQRAADLDMAGPLMLLVALFFAGHLLGKLSEIAAVFSGFTPAGNVSQTAQTALTGAVQTTMGAGVVGIRRGRALAGRTVSRFRPRG